MKKKEPISKQKEDDVGEVIPFELIQGGRVGLDSLPPDRNDWLDPLPVGTLFLTGDKQSADYITPEYEVVDKVPGYTMLRLERPQQNTKTEIWVNTARFSQRYFLAFVLGEFTSHE